MDKKTRTKSNKCPRCNAKMIQRKGKYGDFYGCSSYPKCTYVTKKRFPASVANVDLADKVVPGHFNTTKK